MTLAELFETFNTHKIETLIDIYRSRDRKQYRLNHSFEEFLNEYMVCPICGEITHKDYMTYHAYDIGGVEQKVCFGCRYDEEDLGD